MMGHWTKEPAINGRQQPCLHAGVAESLFPLTGYIGVGFGFAGVTRDGYTVWSENEQDDGVTEMTGAMAEALAAADPDHDWRIVLEGPLSSRKYQRHEAGRWVLIEQGDGFA
jgi:hypothetical protein